ncbi:hypothetical protein EGR_03611 [Echinococcus granulosus]|uniref:Uncharacterized protein n=1 Tax=Echinococcus granulosus TaxID=6210 RepID=W6UT64_ECHGR|nr:hypothetical protein EGR_03611 [Echinococcus granulosus]EUB61547.1 hypothetical protein EGR_03611 [Echinococcus granulosus]
MWRPSPSYKSSMEVINQGSAKEQMTPKDRRDARLQTVRTPYCRAGAQAVENEAPVQLKNTAKQY